MSGESWSTSTRLFQLSTVTSCQPCSAPVCMIPPLQHPGSVPTGVKPYVRRSGAWTLPPSNFAEVVTPEGKRFIDAMLDERRSFPARSTLPLSPSMIRWTEPDDSVCQADAAVCWARADGCSARANSCSAAPPLCSAEAKFCSADARRCLLPSRDWQPGSKISSSRTKKYLQVTNQEARTDSNTAPNHQTIAQTDQTTAPTDQTTARICPSCIESHLPFVEACQHRWRCSSRLGRRGRSRAAPVSP